MEKYYSVIKFCIVLLILTSCKSGINDTQDNKLTKKEISTILSNSKWSLEDFYSVYIDSINESSNKIPYFITIYPKGLEKQEGYLTTHNVKEGKELTYDFILKKSDFNGVINLRKNLNLKKEKNSNEELVLKLINYLIERRSN